MHVRDELGGGACLGLINAPQQQEMLTCWATSTRNTDGEKTGRLRVEAGQRMPTTYPTRVIAGHT